MVRTGFGYDVHRLVEGRRLVIGGVEVPHTHGLEGHSDADVLLHAIADALLGAAALGDIGLHFPNTDAAWEGADSRRLLAHVGRLVAAEGYAINNIDAMAALEAPRLRPYIDAMRAEIAGALGIEAGQVSVKATTSEGLGFVGAAEGAAAYAVACIERR